MDGDNASRELWLDTEGTFSAGYFGDIEIIIVLCGYVYLELA